MSSKLFRCGYSVNAVQYLSAVKKVPPLYFLNLMKDTRIYIYRKYETNYWPCVSSTHVTFSLAIKTFKVRICQNYGTEGGGQEEVTRIQMRLNSEEKSTSFTDTSKSSDIFINT